MHIADELETAILSLRALYGAHLSVPGYFLERDFVGI
jgi:hypothetical protein